MYRFIMNYRINTSVNLKEINIKSESIAGAIKKLFSLYGKDVDITNVEIVKIIEL